MIVEKKFSNINLNIIKYLLLLIPFFLVTGPFLPDLCVVVISIITIVHIFKEKEFHYFKNAIFYFFVCFWLNSFLVTLYNFYFNNFGLEKNSIINSFFYFRFIFFSIAICKVFSEDETFKRLLFLSISACLILLIIDSHFQLFFGKNLINLERDISGRISSFFGDELVLGSYTLRFLFISLCLFFLLNIKSKLKKIIFFFVFIFSVSVIFISGERSSLILLFVGMLISSILFDFKLRHLLIGFVVVASLSFTVINFDDGVKKRLIDRTLLEGGISTTDTHATLNGKKFSFYAQQFNYFLTSYNIFKENNFGSGNKSFPTLCKKYRADKDDKPSENTQSCSSHPHNSYFQLLSENGIQGFFILSFVFIYITYILSKYFFLKFRKQKSLLKTEILILIPIFINFFPFVQNGSFFNNWLSIFYYFPIGIYFWHVKNENYKMDIK